MSIHVLSTTNLNFVGERNQRKENEDWKKNEKKIVVFYSRHTSTENLVKVVNNRTKKTLFFLQAEEEKNYVTLQCVPLYQGNGDGSPFLINTNLPTYFGKFYS